MKKPRVILRRAPVYDPAAIEKIIRDGLAELGLEARVAAGSPSSPTW